MAKYKYWKLDIISIRSNIRPHTSNTRIHTSKMRYCISWIPNINERMENDWNLKTLGQQKGIIDRAPWWNLALSALFYWWMSTLIRGQGCPSRLQLYSRSAPCDHFHKRPAQVTTTFVKPRLNCDLNFLMKGSRKRPRPLLALSNWIFPLFLSSRRRPLRILFI